ncbi:hypothetical protein [Synechocystis sp. PCC 7509]|uniref:hypothetical protein n=1 Tax=Synechocystis sp. PCC 7509 TaxID=927677 RepID=UPI000302862F|nr:hypothetical protein [Synechocystis sp. PCC 7509]
MSVYSSNSHQGRSLNNWLENAIALPQNNHPLLGKLIESAIAFIRRICQWFNKDYFCPLSFSHLWQSSFRQAFDSIGI